jgi:hypothetical protein
VLATLGLIVLATAVLPPMGAVAVNRSRVRFATIKLLTVARTLRDEGPRLLEMARGADVLCGAGDMPSAQSPDAQGWVRAPRAGWGAFAGHGGALPPDPWGNCYLVNLAAANSPGMVVWALSAGPNGIIDTPFVNASELPAGDDVRVRIR